MSDTLNTNQTWNVHTTRTFDAPRAQVWQAWSDAAQVMRWWGPHSWTSPVCNMNFYEGGKIPSDVPHAITFQTLPNGKTELTVTEYGYTSPQVMEISKSGLEECLDKMALLFSKTH